MLGSRLRRVTKRSDVERGAWPGGTVSEIEPAPALGVKPPEA
jgi:hypothetical protein